MHSAVDDAELSGAENLVGEDLVELRYVLGLGLVGGGGGGGGSGGGGSSALLAVVALLLLLLLLLREEHLVLVRAGGLGRGNGQAEERGGKLAVHNLM